jgi:hypothetical protein
VKNQFFGDINDYIKYGLIRLLTGNGEIRTAICWMLTPNDGNTDGKFIDYLHKPESWRDYDPPLYDHLRHIVLAKTREVYAAQADGVLPNCKFYPTLLSDNAEIRASFFEGFERISKGCDLIFFDPDNGLEVKSRPYGRKHSSKYLYWREVRKFFNSGHSLLIYQHFSRVKRDLFIESTARELGGQTSAYCVYSFRTPHVLFLLAAQEQHRELFEDTAKKVASTWKGQIVLQAHLNRS